MTAPRLESHPLIELAPLGEAVAFWWNGRPVEGFAGDTIASALHAAGTRILSRSFKYHRPRGPHDGCGLGPEALVTVDGTPNVLADCTYLRPGMRVESQNAWPSPELDAMAVNRALVPLLPNGFYYKMFHRPRWAWPLFEKMLRRAAGLGRIGTSPPDEGVRYDKRYRFPDACVVGGGPAGLAAALRLAEAGQRVLLIDRERTLGGHLRHTAAVVAGCRGMPELDGLTGQAAARALIERLRSLESVEILAETTAFCVYEDNLVAAMRGRELFKVRAGKVVVAAGASDRHLVFENNDLPGIMTGRAVERLIALHRVVPARRAVVVTCHDGGHDTARMLAGAGVDVAAVVDARRGGSETVPGTEIPVIEGETVHAARGGKRLSSARFGALDGGTHTRAIKCDALVMAVGFKPFINLLAIGNRRPRWDRQRGVLVVDELPEGMYSAGEVNGWGRLGTILDEGFAAGEAAARGSAPAKSHRGADECIAALPADIESPGNNHFICKCMDVTRKEMRASIAEGFDQVETLKRYSSMGMGPCQGKSCFEAVARLAAVDTGLDPMEAVPTTVRPPVSPVPFGVLAGRAPHLVPVRRTAMHDLHIEAGVTFLDSGQWKRPSHYTSPDEEARHVRDGLGLIDVSTLGKVAIGGPDALDFIHFMLPGKFRKLDVGKTRYSTMIGEDGVLFEDGTISRLDDDRYYISTTTGNQDAIVSNFYWWIETLELDVRVEDLSGVYAAVNVSGARSRELLAALVDVDLENESFPYMSCRQGTLAGAPVLLFRIGFTGELSYEIHFPSELGESMWNYLLEQGRSYSLRPFGVEAQRILRLEKAHLLPGVDTDALSNPFEAGVGFTIKTDKPDFVGRSFLLHAQGHPPAAKLVSYRLDEGARLPIDGMAVFVGDRLAGRVTSSRLSPVLGCGVGLAWIDAASSEPGSVFEIGAGKDERVRAVILEHAAYDPDGDRLRA